MCGRVCVCACVCRKYSYGRLNKNMCNIIAGGGIFFILSFFVLYILPFGLVRLRTFRFSAWVS